MAANGRGVLLLPMLPGFLRLDGLHRNHVGRTTGPGGAVTLNPPTPPA